MFPSWNYSIYFCRYDEDDQNDGDEGDDSCTSSEPAAKRTKPNSPSSDVGTEQKLLDHFCNVTLPSEDTDDCQTLFSQFDQPDKIGCMIVDLHPGEMLYLPASWFHEVFTPLCDSFQIYVSE